MNGNKKMSIKRVDAEEIKWDFGSGDYKDVVQSQKNKSKNSSKQVKNTIEKQNTTSTLNKGDVDDIFDDFNEEEF